MDHLKHAAMAQPTNPGGQMNDEAFVKSILLCSYNCRKLYDELTRQNELRLESLQLEKSLQNELITLQRWYDALKSDDERKKRLVQCWTMSDAAIVGHEPTFRTMLFGKNAFFVEQKAPITNRKQVTLLDINNAVKHFIKLLVEEKFKGHNGKHNLEALKKEVVKSGGYLDPSKLFIAGLFGKKSKNWSVDTMNYVPPDVLCRRIAVAIDEYIERLGSQNPVRFNSAALGKSWIKNIIAQQTPDGGTEKLDLLCKTGRRFADYLENNGEELGFDSNKCEYHPLRADGRSTSNIQKDKNEDGGAVDLGSLFKIDGFMPEEFTHNFKHNVIKKLPFAKHPDIIRSGNRTYSRMVRFVSRVEGTVMHIGGTDGEMQLFFFYFPMES